ncbi:MAG: hypothetical protein IPF92_13780 [Myxococcales bacterium]|nr:hypothetical protein [Myxococcales bacterium]MBL0194944.1 hypothetical protein [Myxococcales bacterium]HQY63116.1 hypothetical protein [Polyangiaceae bacterium]
MHPITTRLAVRVVATLVATLAATPLLASCAARGEAPEVVAKRYLELGAQGDLSKVRPLVLPRCATTGVGSVDAVKMMGARMTVTEITTTREGDGSGDAATVRYTVKGSLEAKEGRTETDIFGKTVAVKVGPMSVKGLTKQGDLSLVRHEGRWVVSCR